MTKLKKLLRVMGESKYKAKLNEWIQATIDGTPLKYNFKKLNGALEAGLELDVQVKIGTNAYHYWGRDEFEAKLNGESIDPAEPMDEYPDGLDMLVSHLLEDYARALGASHKEIAELVDGLWSYDNGNLVEN